MDVIVVTGARGVGKTTAAWTSAGLPDNAEKLFVLDTEQSGSELLKLVEPGFYSSITDSMEEKDILGSIADGKQAEAPWVKGGGWNRKVFRWTADNLKQLEKGRYSTVVLDTIEPIEAALTEEVAANKRRYGWQDKSYGRMETQGVRPLYMNLIEGIAQRGVERLVIVSHLKTPWTKQGRDSAPIPGAVTPGGRMSVLSRLSTLMLWLVKGENETGAPDALVLKSRVTRMEKDGTIRAVLPARIPAFSWQRVEEYRETPANLLEPSAGETPSEDEMSMMSELLSNAQMKLMVLSAEERLMVGRMTPEEHIRYLNGIGMTPAEISEETGKPLPEITRILR